jgi:hypothetical protein
MNNTDKKKERLAEALRENLKKRKIQQHARIKNTLIDAGQNADAEKTDKLLLSLTNTNQNIE